MPDFQQDILASFASTLALHVDSMLQSLRVGISHPIAEFPVEAGKNAAYVLYSDRGFPMGAGAILASRGVRESSRIIREVEGMGNNGVAASYRLVEAGSEAIAIQVAQIINDLFSVILPLSGRLGDSDTVGEAVETPTRRRGRQKGSGNERMKKDANGAGRRRRTKAEMAAANGVDREEVSRRKPGRPKKVLEEGGADVTPKRRGRPARVQAEDGIEIPKRRGRRPAAEAGATTKKRPGRPRKVQAEGGESAPKRRGRPKKQAETPEG